MFAPITLRGVTIPNRVVVSPMCMYSAKDGTVNDWHVVHLGSRAVGGAGLVISEMTDVLPEGRISLHCAGMYAPEHVDAWGVTDFIHAHSPPRSRRCACRPRARRRAWRAKSFARPIGRSWRVPIRSRTAARPAGEPRRHGCAMLRAAPKPCCRLRHDRAGPAVRRRSFRRRNKRARVWRPLENRMRFPLEVFNAVRAAWPSHKPISTRISSVDWVDGGTTIDDAIAIARMLHEAGNDILAVSSGGVVSAQPAVGGRVYQASLSDRIRNALGIPTMTVGGIVSHATSTPSRRQPHRQAPGVT
jgi:anthraniloyl-CoA monooxygenase